VTEVSPRTNISASNLASVVNFGGGASDDPSSSSNPWQFFGSIVKDAVAELLAEKNFVVSAKKTPSKKAKKTSGLLEEKDGGETPAVHRDHTDSEGQSRRLGDDDDKAALPKKGRAPRTINKKSDGKATTRSKKVTKKAAALAECCSQQEKVPLPPVEQNVDEEECRLADSGRARRTDEAKFVSVFSASTQNGSAGVGVADVSGSLALLDVDFAVLKVAEEVEGSPPNIGTMSVDDGFCNSSSAIPEADAESASADAADSAKNAAAYDLVRRLGMLSSLRSQESN
jgi:hypothetical protein